MHFDQNKISGVFYRFFLKSWNIRTKLTFLYLAIFGSTLILFSSLLYTNFINTQRNEFDIALYNHAVDLSQGVNVDFFGNITINPDLLSAEGKIFPFSAKSALIQILSLDGNIIARSRNLGKNQLPFSRENWNLLLQNRVIFQSLSAKELNLPEKQNFPKTYRLLTALSPGKSNQDFILQLAVPEILLTPIARDLKKFLWIGIPVTLLFAMWVGLYLSRKALAPVGKMIEKANSLSPQNLAERIPVPPAHDEIQSLALTLNALLERLQLAFESQERFIADASHELKTPLAILRGELDVFRSRERKPEEVSALLNSVAQELNSLSKIVEDLLILARVDAGAEVMSKSWVRFDEILLEVVSKLEILGRQKNVKIRLNLEENEILDGFSIQADTDLLKILMKNLIENAIKYSPSHQVVEVTLHGNPENLILEVTDHGPGIPPEVISKVFDRFYRGPSKDGTQLPGAGLGLAIAKKIAHIHQGTLAATSIPGERTTFSVVIAKHSEPALRKK